MDLKTLHNTYFAMRHGKSQANHEEIVISTPERGIGAYGLTEEGREQVRVSTTKEKEDGLLDSRAIFFSSDFARAHETAEIAAEILGAGPVQISILLRERNFGHYEGTHASNYQIVWDKDTAAQIHSEDTGVENVQDVLKRVLTLIEELEEKYTGERIVLVAHGDVLQILLTAFQDVSAFAHRSLQHFENAEIRQVN